MSAPRVGPVLVVVVALGLGVVTPAGAQVDETPPPAEPGGVPGEPADAPVGEAPPDAPATEDPPADAPPPELPPPPPFPFALDAGTDARERMELADAVRRLHVVAVARLTPQRDEQAERVTGLERRVEAARADHADAVTELAERRERLQVVAADVYMRGSNVRITSAFKAIETADNLVDASRTMRIVDAYGTAEVDGMRSATARRDRLADLVADLDGRLGEARRLLVALRERLQVAEEGARAADEDFRRAQHDLERFHAAATESSSPVLGPTFLSADDLASFVHSFGFRPQLSVPLEELAAMFVEEGEALGVRGDVAWAQSILETGFFVYPGAGKVQPLDNNWAGIGACDSCPRGRVFADAREGVRAQMQLLRTYVDRAWPPDDYDEELLLPRALGLGFRGQVQTWFDLGGRWATGPNYGHAIFLLYQQMRAHAASRTASVVAATAPAGP